MSWVPCFTSCATCTLYFQKLVDDLKAIYEDEFDELVCCFVVYFIYKHSLALFFKKLK